jgi:hypothetical protein
MVAKPLTQHLLLKISLLLTSLVPLPSDREVSLLAHLQDMAHQAMVLLVKNRAMDQVVKRV